MDITPTIHYISNIASSTTTPANLLQIKVAFLLAMAAFLRPSDLHRISASSFCFLSTTMKFKVFKPKKKRKGRHIIKTCQVFKHGIEKLCPVVAVQALLRHPTFSNSTSRPDRLFLNSRHPNEAIKLTIICSYLCKTIKNSTPHTVSIRSLALTIARQRGIDIKDIVTQGNWSSEAIFDTYQEPTSTECSCGCHHYLASSSHKFKVHSARLKVRPKHHITAPPVVDL